MKITKRVGKYQRIVGKSYDQTNMVVLMHRVLLVLFVEKNMYVHWGQFYFNIFDCNMVMLLPRYTYSITIHTYIVLI